MRTADVIIIGAGIIGCACARRLSSDGLRVLILDAAFPGAGATAAGMGHIVVMDDSQAMFSLTLASREAWARLAHDLPPRAEHSAAGTLWVAADQEELDAAHRKHAFLGERGVTAELLDPDSLRCAEPNLRPGLAGGLFVPGDLVVYPPTVAAWLLGQAVRLGARAVMGSRVVRVESGRVTIADGSVFESPAIVNAGGQWCQDLTPDLPIRRRKGHLLITDRSPGFCRHQVIELGYIKKAHASDEDSVAFNIQPRPTGQVLIGSSRQFDPIDEQGRVRPLDDGIDHAILANMIRRAAEYMPTVAGLRALRAWTGFRAATPDSLPLIGPHPRIPGLWLATGHEGLGVTNSLGTADLLADLMASRTPAIPAEPYSPARLFSHG